MGLTRVGGDVLQTPLNVGVVTATEINAGIVSATSLYGDGSALTGIAATDNIVTNGIVVVGVSTLGNTVVGGATTELIVNGDARVTGILTIGTSSITLDGSENQVNVGTGVTIHHTNGVQVGGNTLHSTGFTVNEIRVGTGITIAAGIISATEFRGNGANLTTLNASNLDSGTIPDARFPATLPSISGANLTNLPSTSAFSSGTLMLFQQTAAPTGWTKQTTHNDKTLRVVSGNASSGGTTAFTSVFTGRTPSGSVSVSNAAVTLSESQMPSHTHYVDGSSNYGSTPTCWTFDEKGILQAYNTNYVKFTGGSGSHTHSNTASFSGSSMDFDVQYVDLIIASKD